MYLEFDRAGLELPEVVAEKHLLYDGQRYDVLIPQRAIDFANVTGIIIETDSHGNQIKKVNFPRRIELSLILALPSWIVNPYLKFKNKFLIRDARLREALRSKAIQQPIEEANVDEGVTTLPVIPGDKNAVKASDEVHEEGAPVPTRGQGEIDLPKDGTQFPG